MGRGRPARWRRKPLPGYLSGFANFFAKGVERGLALVDGVRGAIPPVFPHHQPRQALTLKLGVRVMNCGVDQLDVVLGVLLGARSLDALDFVKVERSQSGIELLSRYLAPEVAAPVSAEPSLCLQLDLDPVSTARYELGFTDAHHRLPHVRGHFGELSSNRLLRQHDAAIEVVVARFDTPVMFRRYAKAAELSAAMGREAQEKEFGGAVAARHFDAFG